MLFVGGIAGRERLRILARVMRPTTLDLLRRLDVQPGMACLDVGCGGGDVSFELAQLVGSRGRVIGIDNDSIKIDVANSEAAEHGFANVQFKLADIADTELEPEFDLVYARFLLTHLRDPARVLARMKKAVRDGRHPGGR